MPRGMPGCDQYFAKFEAIAALYFFGPKAVLSATFSTRVDLRGFKTRAKLARTADQIGMNMRLENVRNSESCFAGHVNIDVDIGSRIENCSYSFIVVA